MADYREAEIREIKLKVENLLHAARRPSEPQQVGMGYLQEVRKLRLRLIDLGVDDNDD